jgi:hypothetical protein
MTHTDHIVTYNWKLLSMEQASSRPLGQVPFMGLSIELWPAAIGVSGIYTVCNKVTLVIDPLRATTSLSQDRMTPKLLFKVQI